MSYDELGWRVDGLRKMASLGVESYYLLLGENKKDWVRRNERWGFLEGGVKPEKSVDMNIPGGVL